VVQILRHLLKFIGSPWFIVHGVLEVLRFWVVSNGVLLNLFLEAWNWNAKCLLLLLNLAIIFVLGNQNLIFASKI